MRTLITEFQSVFLGPISDCFDLDDPPASYGARAKGRRAGSPGKHYHYAYVGNKDVKRGDWALVHNGTEFGVVQIKRVVPGIAPNVTKHVIEVLTQAEFEAYQARNKRIDELRSSLDELEHRLEQDKKLDKYRDLAKRDTRAKELLEQLQGFFGIGTSSIEAPAAASTATEQKADGQGSSSDERAG